MYNYNNGHFSYTFLRRARRSLLTNVDGDVHTASTCVIILRHLLSRHVHNVDIIVNAFSRMTEMNKTRSTENRKPGEGGG